jgi:hypothetical protein
MPCSSSAQPPVFDSEKSSEVCTRYSANSMLIATISAATRVQAPMMSSTGASTSPM